MKTQLNEIKRMQQLAGLLNENQTLADINPSELGSIMNIPKEWEFKDLKVIEGPFTEKYPEYKNADAVFISYDNKEELVMVEFENGKSAKLYPKELQIK
jgi:hypothetical protein